MTWPESVGKLQYKMRDSELCGYQRERCDRCGTCNANSQRKFCTLMRSPS